MNLKISDTDAIAMIDTHLLRRYILRGVMEPKHEHRESLWLKDYTVST